MYEAEMLNITKKTLCQNKHVFLLHFINQTRLKEKYKITEFYDTLETNKYLCAVKNQKRPQYQIKVLMTPLLDIAV